ncbi:MAG: response regulator [Chloroflexota bacterium]|nr:response regulator [Chloroflexota bacterium]
MTHNKKYTVVHVDDDSGMIELTRLLLAPHNFEVIGATDGRKGLETMRRMDPNLVLLDLMMPDLDGWEVYHQMKDEPGLQDIPIIVITAKNENVDRVLGLHIAKVAAYITKPFSARELLDCIDGIFATKG